jgi:hypothetical protein
LVGYNGSCGMGRRSYGNASIIKAMRMDANPRAYGNEPQ